MSQSKLMKNAAAARMTAKCFAVDMGAVDGFSSDIQKIFQQIEARGGQDGFGMKLHAFDAKFAMAQAHDDNVVRLGGNFQVARERLALDDERVVARCSEWFREIFENAAAIVFD